MQEQNVGQKLRYDFCSSGLDALFIFLKRNDRGRKFQRTAGWPGRIGFDRQKPVKFLQRAGLGQKVAIGSQVPLRGRKLAARRLSHGFLG